MDRVLDRIPSKPDRRRDLEFSVAAVIEGLQPRSYTWAVGLWVDQKAEGACVPHSWVHEAAAKPIVVQFPRATPDGRTLSAQDLCWWGYDWCRRNDEWAGENYAGTSVAAGARMMTHLGLLPEYRWTNNADELAVAVSRKGPCVIGIDWYSGMYAPDLTGFLRLTGRVEGGHAILVNGYSMRMRAFRVHNSWGRDWGMDGEALVAHDDMAQLMAQGGEGCLPVRRTP